MYRRRPNNSRKKRRPDSDPHSPTDPSLGGGDDDASIGETSPTEEDVLRDQATPSYGFRSTVSGSQAYDNGDTLLSSQQPPAYSYMPDFNTAGQYGQSTRVQALPSAESQMSAGGIPPLRIPSLAETPVPSIRTASRKVRYSETIRAFLTIVAFEHHRLVWIHEWFYRADCVLGWRQGTGVDRPLLHQIPQACISDPQPMKAECDDRKKVRERAQAMQ